MEAGRLKHRLRIERPTTTVSGGDPAESWATVSDVRGEILTQGTREVYRAQQVQADVTHVVRIRYRDDLTSRMRLKFGTRYLYIAGMPMNEDEACVTTLLPCRESEVV